MINKPLLGQTVAILVESKFIPEEIEAYLIGFSILGAKVEFISRLWGNAELTFISDVDPNESQHWESPRFLKVDVDFKAATEKLHKGEYQAVIISANYTSVRLRYAELTEEAMSDLDAFLKTPPAVAFFEEATKNKQIIKGALCHGLWILTPNPDLLMNRRVICHPVVMADIRNCGAIIELTKDKVVVENDLVTGYSKNEVLPFIERIAFQMLQTT